MSGKWRPLSFHNDSYQQYYQHQRYVTFCGCRGQRFSDTSYKISFCAQYLAFMAADWIAVPTLLSSVVYFATQLTVTFYIVIFMKVIWSLRALLALVVAGCRVAIVPAAVPVSFPVAIGVGIRLWYHGLLSSVVTRHTLLTMVRAGRAAGWLKGQMTAVKILAALVVALAAPNGISGLGGI